MYVFPDAVKALAEVQAMNTEDRLLLEQFLQYCDRNSLPLLRVDSTGHLRLPDGVNEFYLSPAAAVGLMRDLRRAVAVPWDSLPRRPAGSDR